MLELNKWFFVLLVNFLVLIYVLNLILFKPLLRLFTERDNSIKGSLGAARDMEKKKEDAVAAMNRELKEARGKANELFEGVKKEGLQRQKELLEGANKRAQDFILTAKGELNTEAEKARQKLRSDVEKFSEEIVKKLVGV
jgi:F-type H+-transporting ATPase subunit b